MLKTVKLGNDYELQAYKLNCLRHKRKKIVKLSN